MVLAPDDFITLEAVMKELDIPSVRLVRTMRNLDMWYPDLSYISIDRVRYYVQNEQLYYAVKDAGS